MQADQHEADAEEFGVLPENYSAVEVFLACGTQWERDSRGVLSGLPYDRVRVALDCFAPDDWRDAFRRLRVIEIAAIDAARRMSPST